jgi:hypothetical protein
VIWSLITAQSHIDVKCTLSHFGAIVSDTTTQHNLISMTKSSLMKLCTTVAQARTRKEATIGIVLNNIQNYVLVHQDGIGKALELKVGTAATAIFLHPHAPGAFNAADHTKRVTQKLLKELTTERFTRMLIGSTSTTLGHFTGFEAWSNMSLGSKVIKKRSTDCLGQLPLQNAACLRVGRLIFSLWVPARSVKRRHRGCFEQYRTF